MRILLEQFANAARIFTVNYRFYCFLTCDLRSHLPRQVLRKTIFEGSFP